MAGLSSPNILRKAAEDSPSDEILHAQSTNWENPCSKRGDQRRIDFFACNFMKILYSRAGSNSIKV